MNYVDIPACKNEITIALTCQLWNNVRMAYADQPDYVELAEKLFQNFEALYQKEVWISLSPSQLFELVCQ